MLGVQVRNVFKHTGMTTDGGKRCQPNTVRMPEAKNPQAVVAAVIGNGRDPQGASDT